MKYDEYGAWDEDGPDTSWLAAVAQFLEQSQRRHKEWVAAELDRIDDQLDRRDAVHAEIVDELEWKIARYTDQLKQLYNTGMGKQDGTRDRLKDRLATAQQELREEDRNHWQDRQELEHERRDILRELAEVEDDVLSEFL